jgi:non-specific serine/threonine protein kinase
VATDLPEREEILIYTDMGHRQRQVYERYRETYRRRVEQLMTDGDVMKAMLEIVQGLLKLRQIVLFPGLVDSKYSNYPSCKLERFGEMIDTIIDEGNKALVFSQFVQVLTRLRYQLDRKGVPYAYLDGSTRNRQDEIDRFQSQRELPVFLISLKAGGLGVNLTAAEYVLLFDPWWNPAVEAQAIDRTHRIGQRKKVIAYRLVVRDTVEEKILTLQERKREIAQAIVPTEASWIKALSKEDVLELFS